jgi:hypothetical protein
MPRGTPQTGVWADSQEKMFKGAEYLVITKSAVMIGTVMDVDHDAVGRLIVLRLTPFGKQKTDGYVAKKLLKKAREE